MKNKDYIIKLNLLNHKENNKNKLNMGLGIGPNPQSPYIEK